jgi:hypothetical protein
VTSKKGPERAEPEQAEVVHLVINDRGLQLDLNALQEAERCSALQNPAGRIVFVYRKAVPAHPALRNNQPAFHKIAA